VHAAATRGNDGVDACRAHGGELLLELGEVLEGGAGGDVAAVEENVEADRLDTRARSTVEEEEHLLELGVDAAVREKAEEVDRLAGGDGSLDSGLPRRGGKESTVSEGIVDETGTLSVDLAGAES
jgi:hypothetical protein